MRLFRSCFWLPFALLGTWSAATLRAQTPDLVVVFKVTATQQTLAATSVPAGFGYGLGVEFSAAVPTTTTVQLTGARSISVPRIDSASYFAESYFTSAAGLEQALPNGTYALNVSGGGTPSSTPVTVTTGEIGSTIFTNFDALQAWSEPRVRFTWAPISGGNADDIITFTVARANGTILYESPEFGEPGALDGRATSIEVDGLPLDEPLTARLLYIRYAFSFANGNRTIVASGRGFGIEAPVRRVSVRPTIAWQPQPALVRAGETAAFSVGATGNNLSYQWRRNGVPLAGATHATLLLPAASANNAGFYTVDVSNASGSVTSDSVTLALSANPAAPPSRISNLAIRSRAGGTDQMLIVGFAIGPATAVGNQTILLRGIGPTLAGFGVPDVLSNPQLTLFTGAHSSHVNDDWGGDPRIVTAGQQVGAFALPDPRSLDAAIYDSRFGAGTYTAHLMGPAGATGVALAEIYDASGAATTTSPRLINVSARTQVGTQADILIAGFVIAGDSGKTVLIRAVGPTLGNFGVFGTLRDPKLELFRGTTKLHENDDWGGATPLATTFSNVGAFALTAQTKDSALLLTLPPGSYTAQVSGVNNATGIALVEIYEVP
jgi:hypothetical protein